MHGVAAADVAFAEQDDDSMFAKDGDADGRASSPVREEAQSVRSLNLDKFQSSKLELLLLMAGTEVFIFSAMAPLR